ncbi:isoform X1 [Ancistrocladus abbreviatus]
MEKSRRRAPSSRGMEENTMAILDVFGASDSSHLTDDRIAFLEAVRSASIVPENGTPPTNKMWQAIFQILREGKSLELIMASYQLLTELEKCFPRVYLCNGDKTTSSPSKSAKLAVIEEAWSPFYLSSDAASSEKDPASRKSNGPLDSSGFHTLLQGIIEVDTDTEVQPKILVDMLLFQYLVNVLEGDLSPRNGTYLETADWTLLRESLLNMLLGSRRINYKVFIKDCLYLLSRSCSVYDGCNSEPRNAEKSLVNSNGNIDVALSLALHEVGKSTLTAVQKLLVMMMELDSSRKKADMDGLTTRADGLRTPALEIILDELTYDNGLISPFFMVLDEPKLKLEIVMKYFRKYIAKPSVRTRRSNDATDTTTITGVLRSFSNGMNTKSIIKKISTEVVQLLIAYAFQACLSLPNQQLRDVTALSEEDVENGPLREICKNVISAFNSLKEIDGNMEILPLGQEALFTAGTILSAKS